MVSAIPHIAIDGEWKKLIESDDWRPAKPSTDSLIWRYRDFNRYLSILENEELWFCRADQFSDPFEGSLPQKNIEEREIKNDDAERTMAESLSLTYRTFRKMTYLNCWHLNQYESAAMWNLYLSEDQGVAIVSTPNRLEDALNLDSDSYLLGSVDYIDYTREKISDNSMIAPFYHKRKSFEHENEYRVLHRNWSSNSETSLPANEIGSHYLNGGGVSVDLDKLVKEVRVSPSADLSFKYKVELETRVAGYDFQIVQSDMNSTPVF